MNKSVLVLLSAFIMSVNGIIDCDCNNIKKLELGQERNTLLIDNNKVNIIINSNMINNIDQYGINHLIRSLKRYDRLQTISTLNSVYDEQFKYPFIIYQMNNIFDELENIYLIEYNSEYLVNLHNYNNIMDIYNNYVWIRNYLDYNEQYRRDWHKYTKIDKTNVQNPNIFSGSCSTSQCVSVKLAFISYDYNEYTTSIMNDEARADMIKFNSVIQELIYQKQILIVI